MAQTKEQVAEYNKRYREAHREEISRQKKIRYAKLRQDQERYEVVRWRRRQRYLAKRKEILAQQTAARAIRAQDPQRKTRYDENQRRHRLEISRKRAESRIEKARLKLSEITPERASELLEFRRIERIRKKSARDRAYNKANREKIAEKHRIYHIQHRAERLEKSRIYRAENRERILRAKHAYYLANKERIIAETSARRRERVREQRTKQATQERIPEAVLSSAPREATSLRGGVPA